MESNEEHYVSDVGYELEPVFELVGNWMERQNTEHEPVDCNNVEVLQKKIHEKESTIQMLAEVSAALLQLYNGAKAVKCEHNAEFDVLKEEVTQLHYRNSSLCEQVKKLEDDLAEADHDEEDLIEHKKQLSCMLLLSKTQNKLEDLEKENTELSVQVSELHSELRLREDQLFEDRARMKKLIAQLKQSLVSKEAEVMKLENDQRIFKADLKQLNCRLRAVEIEAEELREELSKSNRELNVYKSKFERSEMTHAECRDMLKDARCQLRIYKEMTTKTKFLRHIQNRNSPYVDPDSIACELERVYRDRSRPRFDVSTSEYSSILTTNLFDDTSSILCDDISDLNSDVDSVDGNVNYDHLEDYLLMMGQPGRPGTEDLEVALKRLKQLQEWKVSEQNQPLLPFHSYSSTPRFPRRIPAEADSVIAVSSSAAVRRLPPFLQCPQQKLFCEGLNAVGLTSGSQSGVLIRGCEVPDIFVKIERSMSEIEEDEVDLPTGCSLMQTSASIDHDSSLSCSQSDSGCFESEDKTENELSDVPTSEPKMRLKIENSRFSGWGERSLDEGSILHRTCLRGHTSNATAQQLDFDGNQEVMSEDGVLNNPKDCIVS